MAIQVEGRWFRGLGAALPALVLALGGALGVAHAGRAAEVRAEASTLLNEGVSAYNRGLYGEAADKLGRCAAIELNSARAHYYYGLALARTQRFREALGALAVALDLEPQNLQALVALGDVHLDLGDVDEARASYARALKLLPTHPPALDGLARAAEAMADDDRAIELYREAIAANQGFAPAYTHLGDLYMRRGKIGEAVALLEEGVRIRPDFAEGRNRLAVAYGRLGMDQEAVATVQKAIELEPAAAVHHETLGFLQLDQGLLVAAEGSFERALTLGRARPGSRMGLAEVARRRGDYDGALAELDAADRIEDLGSAVREKLAELRASLTAERERMSALDAARAAGTATPQDHAELADVLARRGHWAEAAEMQRLAPTTPEGEEWLAFLLFQAGRFREAHEIYARLAAADVPHARLNAGVALAQLGDDAAAASEFESLLEGPDGPLARLYIGNALLRMGKNHDAARSYRAYLDAVGTSESAERVRRILKQIAPDLVPQATGPTEPQPPAPTSEPGATR